MNQLNDPPLKYTAGQDFDYDVWTADTSLTLVNVPWDNLYKDVVRFESPAALDAYIDSQSTTASRIAKASRVRLTGSIRIEIPFNAARRYNYIRADNPIQPIQGDIKKTYYYFILDANEVNPSTTELVVQLDVYQTYIYGITLGNAFVERGHIGVANRKRFDNYGRDYLTIPEGLDVGGEYQTVFTRTIVPMQSLTFNIMIGSTLDLTEDQGDNRDPDITMAPGGRVQNITSGVTYYVFQNQSKFQSFINKFKKKPWVTQGIIHISVIPNLLNWYPDWTWADEDDRYYGKLFPGAYAAPQVVSASSGSWRTGPEMMAAIPDRYEHVKDKFFTFPYMYTVMTTWGGDAVIIKPESWQADRADVAMRVNFVPPNQRIQVAPMGYNKRPGATANDPNSGFSPLDDTGDLWNMSITMGDFPRLALLNDAAALYMANNAHGFAQQAANNDWSYQKAQAGAQLSYDQATMNANTATALHYNAQAADAAGVALQQSFAQSQGVFGALESIGQGALGGSVAGPAGAAVGAGMGAVSAGMKMISSGMNAQNQSDQLALRISSGNRSQEIQRSNATYMRDSNKSMADFANKGDYQNAQAQLAARTQDAQMIPPSLTTNAGGEMMNFVNRASEFSFRWKFLDLAHIVAIGDYWLRWGYAVQRYVRNIPADMHVMTKFTYWKLSETYLIGASVPEGMKQVLRGIYEKGVTQYRNPADIGTVDMSTNAPIGGVTIE